MNFPCSVNVCVLLKCCARLGVAAPTLPGIWVEKQLELSLALLGKFGEE